jgi:chloramphenicol 3-O phosphotransferase
MARIILLNGVGSAGKSSIARALQAITSKPYLHVAMDSFLDMLPASYWDHPDGFTFTPVTDAAEPLLKSGQAAWAQERCGACGAPSWRSLRKVII